VSGKKRKLEIGEFTTRRIEVEVCGECGCVIGETGMCSYDCGYDGDPHPPEIISVHVWERIDTLLEIRSPK
jgi:hypothetical protein